MRLPLTGEVRLIKVWFIDRFALGAKHWFSIEDTWVLSREWKVSQSQGVQCVLQTIARLARTLDLSLALLIKRTVRADAKNTIGAKDDMLRCIDGTTF